MNVYVRQVSSALAELGCQVDIFTREHCADHHGVVSLNEHARVVHLQAGPVDAPKEDLFGHLPSFAHELEKFRESNSFSYDLIHSHYWLSGWIGNDLSREWGVPHVTTFHTTAELKGRTPGGDSEPGMRSCTERKIAASSDRIIASTRHEYGSLVSLYEADQDRIRVVPAGVDLDMFRPEDQRRARDKLGLNGERIVLYVGRMDAIKGLDVLIHSVASMETPSNLKVLVIGGSKQDKEFNNAQELVNALEVVNKVDLLGTLEHESLPLYYQAADVCVVPSYYESFSLVALESMACGTPVVASRVGGLQTVVKDNQSGYLVPWHCPDAFADRLEVLLSNDSLRKSLGIQASELAKRLSWKATASSIADVYAELGVTPAHS